MKKKTSSIEDLKNEGLVQKASELKFTKPNKKSYDGKKLDASIIDEMEFLTPIWEFKTEINPKAKVIMVSYEDNEKLLWLKEFLKANKKRFQTFMTEVEEMYLQMQDKGKKVAKNDKKVGLPSDKPSKSEFMVNYKRKKLFGE